MNTAIATTLISVLGAGLFGGLYGMFFHFMRATNAKLDKISEDVARLDTKFTGQIKELEIRLTGQINDLETRVAAQFKELEIRLTGQINDLDTRVAAQFKEHGERLARIEAKLGIDPTVQAA
ncbi:MAG: hypothetical protein OXF04_10545 [bacterium]|nr:hypothetical protein [bacterium]